ncbi:MAG: hypothetical protein H0X40_13365 [Chthoniobacterales bacterium]|nr:hypothetical protein [Chthoniobacterales bacterium]
MNALPVAAISFACVFGAALLGFLLRSAIPEEHLSDQTKDVVKLSMGLVATMTALILGLLVASAKDAYDAKKAETLQMAARIAYLDRGLANYGPETAGSRALLREIVERMIAKLWPDSDSAIDLRDDLSGFRGAQLYDSIQKLSPANDLQRSLKSQALTATGDLGQMRWLLAEQGGSSISTSLLIIVVSWLAILFLSFALFAPPNATVIAALMIASLSVSGGILLILELDRPFDGFIKISSEPMRHTLTYLAH